MLPEAYSYEQAVIWFNEMDKPIRCNRKGYEPYIAVNISLADAYYNGKFIATVSVPNKLAGILR